MTKQRTQQKLTKKLAPMVPGLYSVQALSADDKHPDITIYRQDTASALEWKTKQARTGKFSRFLLRHGVTAWDVYGANGKLESLCDDVMDDQVPEYPAGLDVDRDIDAEVRGVLGDGVTRLVSSEGHAEASSANHANFLTILHNFVATSATENDLKHIYLAESHGWPGRVVGIYADIASLSGDMSDKYLDWYSWIKQSHPLDNALHKSIFAHRLGRLKKRYLSEVFATTAEDEDATILTKFKVQMADEAIRIRLAADLINLCYNSLNYNGRLAETFDDSALEENKSEMIALLQEAFK